MTKASGTGIRGIFEEIPKTYELVNHLMTFGLDTAWRRGAAAEAASAGGTRWLDLCTGTGETAAYLLHRADPATTVAAADFSLPMLRQARGKRSCRRVAFVAGAAGELPFPGGTFDLVTVTFATRNINVSRDGLLACFREIHRVLRPGGTFVNLETSRPPRRFLCALLDGYARIVVPRLGSSISGSRAGYSYLAHSIARFYGAEDLASIMREAGFSEVSFRRVTWGVAAVHRAVK